MNLELIQQRLSNLTQRERYLLMGLGGLIVVLLLVLGLQQLITYQRGLSQKLEILNRQYNRLQDLEKEWRYVSTVRNGGVIAQPLSTFLENGSRMFGMQNQIQLNQLTTTTPKGMEGIQVKLDQLSLDQLFDMIYFLENNVPVLLVDHLEITTIQNSNLLRAEFRIYKQISG